MSRMQVDKTVDFILLVQNSRRITIRRLEKETGLPRSTIYKYLKVIGKKMEINVEKGVVSYSPKA